MWSTITEFCKVFAEKHLIPSTISIVGAILSLLRLPENYWMITKIGKVLFFILVASIIFLAIRFITFCYQKFCAYRNNNEQKKYNHQSAAKNEKNNLEDLWTAVDKFSPDDRKLLKEFLDSNNTPITRSSGERYFGNSLLASNWVVSTEEYDEKHSEKTQPIVFSDNHKGLTVPIHNDFIVRQLIVKYKLHDDIFQFLKYSKEKYGKISHFE